MYTVHCVVYTVHCTVYSIQYTVCTVHYTVYSIQYTVYTVQYTVCTVCVKDMFALGYILLTKQMPRKMKSRFVVTECAGYVFWQLFL